MEKTFKTKKQIERDEKYQVVYNEIKTLLSNPKNSKMAVYEYVMEKYGYKIATIYRILRICGNGVA